MREYNSINRKHLTDYHAWHSPKEYCNTCVPCLKEAINDWTKAFWDGVYNQELDDENSSNVDSRE